MWHALSNAVWGDGSARNEDISEKEIEKSQNTDLHTTVSKDKLVYEYPHGSAIRRRERRFLEYIV